MIALDTNALVRLLMEDDPQQAESVREIITLAENNKIEIILLSEVLIETVWVLESAYNCTRDEIATYLENILSVGTFIFPDFSVIQKAAEQYKVRGDFADLMFCYVDIAENAQRMAA